MVGVVVVVVVVVGGVALIKLPGGSQLLLTVDLGCHFFDVFRIFFDHSLDLHFCSFGQILKPLWVAMLALLAFILYTSSIMFLVSILLRICHGFWTLFLWFFMIFRSAVEV